MASACCADIKNLERWDCACSWGCDCCDLAARCKACGELHKTGQVVAAQRAAGLCASPWCTAAAAPKIKRCLGCLTRRQRKQYNAARRQEAALAGGARC